MSTPSVTILKNLVLNWKSNQMEEETIATFYRHYDGYPSCHAIDIANSLVVASRTKPEQHIDFSGASVERNILNNRNWCQHFLKAMCMADADIEFIGEDNVPSASYTLQGSTTSTFPGGGSSAITGADAATRDEAGMTWGSRSDGAREGMNMGKEKIEEKDVRLLRYAVEQAFDGAMRDGALALLNRLVDSASEAANLEEELLNLKGEYQRSMENSKRGAFKRLDAAYKRKCRREKRMAKGQMLCADGKPVMFGETLYGGDGRDWLIVGIAGAWSYDVYGLHVAHDGKKEKKPLRAEWLVHELTDAGEEV